MILIVFICLLLIGIGIFEKLKHHINVRAIDIRINVNGIRGKSTATRLITGILTEAGYKTIGKTTGTSARKIYWFTNEEKPIERASLGPNIKEQIHVINEAAKLGANALVCECMAVNPDYQKVYQEQMIKANIGIIVNVLEDHLDVMGPTLDNIAEAFITTIPYNGTLIITKSPYVKYFTEIANKRNTKVIVCDTSKININLLTLFEYIIFPENIAIAMAVAKVLKIDMITTWNGMLNSNPDPGILRIHKIGSNRKPSFFVNGFAANEPTSSLNILKHIHKLGYQTKNAVIIMNGRQDRVDRTIQFANDFFPFVKVDTIVLIGESLKPIVDAYSAGRIHVKNFINLEGKTGDQVYKVIEKLLPGRVIYGVGNIHGCAEVLIEIFNKMIIKNNFNSNLSVSKKVV